MRKIHKEHFYCFFTKVNISSINVNILAKYNFFCFLTLIQLGYLVSPYSILADENRNIGNYINNSECLYHLQIEAFSFQIWITEKSFRDMKMTFQMIFNIKFHSIQGL